MRLRPVIPLWAWAFSALVDTVDGQDYQCPTNASSSFSNPLDALHLAYPNITTTEVKGNALLGRQNFTYCCILAFSDYLNHVCADTTNVTVTELRAGSQFPCGAEWSGDTRGAPVVKASFAWTKKNCGGWEISSADKLNQWLQLLVGFILPAVVFCLNIPRRRRLKVWSDLFPQSVSVYDIFIAPFGAVVAVLTVAVDMITWLLTVFAMAAPALLSGIYEACLDHQIIEFLDENPTAARLPLSLRARMLFTILCGNLDLYPAWSDTMQLAASLDVPSGHARENGQAVEHTVIQEDVVEKDVTTVEESGRKTDSSSEDKQGEKSCSTSSQTAGTDSGSSEAPASNDHASHIPRESIDRVASRLKAMLACQYDFGSIVGAPVLFYVGSFIYTILDIRQSYGDPDVSHALSFGVWWMVIPHIAIVAGFLLGGNNPNTLEGIVSAEESEYEVGTTSLSVSMTLRRGSTFQQFQASDLTHGWYSHAFEKVYNASYKPASMWNRGRSKQSWLLVLYVDSILRYQEGKIEPAQGIRSSMGEFITKTVIFGIWPWVWVAIATMLLILIPCLFGYLLSYFTPQVGLACRSLTFTIYASAQALLLVLWIIRTTWRDRYWRQGRRIRRVLSETTDAKSFLEEIHALGRMAQRDSTQTACGMFRCRCMNRVDSHDQEKNSRSAVVEPIPCDHTNGKRKGTWLYYIFLVLGLGVSIFSAIGGTLMQLMGVYRNNVCKINVNWWSSKNRDAAMVQLSTNSAEAIRQAKGTWTVLGTLSVVVLIACCYIGWWYQTRLRERFERVAQELNGVTTAEDTGKKVIGFRCVGNRKKHLSRRWAASLKSAQRIKWIGRRSLPAHQ